VVESRALLGEHLRLYQIHSATLDSGVLEDRAVLDELAGLRSEGLVIGFSVTGPEQAQTIRRALEVGIFDTVQATWNLLERSPGPALAEAHDAGLGVIVKEALANGRLTARGGDSVLAQVSAERGISPDALAFAAALAQPWADVVLSGATTVDQLRSNLAALDVEWDEELERRLAPLVEEPGRYWSKRSALPWN
jgi:aryl-alcohol dehydrogenase-like predicted oxidoreductase